MHICTPVYTQYDKTENWMRVNDQYGPQLLYDDDDDDEKRA